MGLLCTYKRLIHTIQQSSLWPALPPSHSRARSPLLPGKRDALTRRLSLTYSLTPGKHVLFSNYMEQSICIAVPWRGGLPPPPGWRDSVLAVIQRGRSDCTPRDASQRAVSPPAATRVHSAPAGPGRAFLSGRRPATRVAWLGGRAFHVLGRSEVLPPAPARRDGLTRRAVGGRGSNLSSP
jgi:hypothetical protein